MNSKDDKPTHSSFWTRKISIWHIIYIIVICLIINIFLLCIVPGRINDEAYHNFTFAATITSIVLAVVSIVYSIQSGLMTFNRMGGIRDIEDRIGEELDRFKDLDASIKSAIKEGISPLEASMGDIMQRQDDIQKAQDELSINWKSLMQNVNSGIKVAEEDGDLEEPTILKNQSIPQIFSIILYTCSNSQKTHKDIPFHILGQFFGTRSYYCEGVIKSLSVFSPDVLRIGVGSKPNRMVIEYYDENSLGKTDWLRKQAIEGKNKRLGGDIIVALDNYFSEITDCDKTEGSV